MEFTSLQELVTYVRRVGGSVVILDPLNRRELLGVFLEMDDVKAYGLGSYDMDTGDWRLRSGLRSKTRISTVELEKEKWK